MHALKQMLGALYLELFGPKPPSLLLSVSPAAQIPSPMGGQELSWEGLLWAVPKKRTSHSKKRMRSAHKYLKPRSDYITCPKCKNLKLLHVLCAYCLKETLAATAEMRRAEVETKVKTEDKTTFH